LESPVVNDEGMRPVSDVSWLVSVLWVPSVLPRCWFADRMGL